MEIHKEKKKVIKHTVALNSPIPSAPTIDDFYIDPGIEDISDPCKEDAKYPGTDTVGKGPSEKALTPALSDPLGATIDICDTEIVQANAPLLEDDIATVIIPSHMNPHAAVHNDLLHMSPHSVVHKELAHMSPHLMLQKELSNVSIDCEASAPELGEQILETKENHFGEGESQEERVITDINIVPFTDSQLHALYHNAELEKNLEFVDHWLDTQKNIEKFQLDEMLVNYLRVRTLLGSSKNKYNIDRAHVETLCKELWVFSTDSIEEEGECEDGNIVIVTRDSKVAEFSDNVSQSLRSRLKQCKETLTEDYSLHCFRSEVLKVKIDEFLHSVLVRQQGGTVERTLVYSPAEEVRLCVSVLFKFLRKDIHDDTMVRDLKQWLDRMVAVVLSEATLYDHLFLLNHIMRCPAGVGKWAAAYIQPAIPLTDLEETSFDNPFLDHLITILATILLPVKERRNFVHEFGMKHQWQQETSEDDCEQHDKIWTVLDGEGSEDEDPEECWAQLREVDLVALISQVPVDHMFRYVLRIEMRDGCDHYNVHHSTQHSFLKLYAFSTQFVYLIREGLKTFNTPKYRQFAKRLGRLIRHTVHYVSDHWENFKRENKGSIDSSMLLRLQVEYDSFFLRAAKCIFSSQKLGTWQYLADIPFATISPNMLWRIFYVLHLDYRDEHHSDFGVDITDWAKALSCPDLQLQFEEKCTEAGDTEIYFLLSAFANMAISRGMEDVKFIERATLDLFDVGFVCETTRESCSKNCRDLLAGVCHKHPFLLTTILNVMSDRVQHIGKLCGYLLQELPWIAWRPELAELKLVYDWLVMPVTTIESHLARIIISRMDWEYGALHTDLHISTAINIVQAVIKHNPDAGVANTSMATMTNLAMVSITSLASAHSQFVSWAWESVSRLHLHMLDRSTVESRGIMEGNVDVFRQVLDFDLDRQLEVVAAGSVRKVPLACYTSLLLTQLGHSLPEMLDRGLTLLKVVQEAGRMDHVLEMLMYTIPLLVADPSSINNVTFQSIIANLLAADQSYISMAKSIISGTFPGPVTREAGNLLEKMIANYSKYGHESPKEIIDIWMKILTSLPDWNVNQSALFLLDIICCHSFFDPPIHSATLQAAKDLHSKFLLDSSGGIITWITGTNYSGHKLVFPTSIPQFPWVAYFFLQSEDIHCRETGIWTAMVKQLSQHKNLEEALSTAAASCETSPPLSSQLPIYRWLQQAIETPPDHPLVPIFWQRFFQLFLSRPLPSQEGEETRGVGMSFFVGIFNTMYFNKIKSSLKLLQDFQSKKSSEAENNDKESGKENRGCLTKLYKTFYMWLDEAKILDSTLYIPALSPVYEPEKLAQILSGDRTLWMDYVDNDGPLIGHRKAIDEWDKLHFRVKLENKLRKPYNDDSDMTPSERILKRLQSYEPRMSPIVRKEVMSPLPIVPIDILVCEEALIPFLQTPLGILSDMSTQFSTNTSAYGSLNCSYLELVPMLWKDEDIEVFVKKTCPGTKRGKEKFDCSGAAQIVLNYTESKKQEAIAVKIEANRKDWECSETKLLAPPGIQFVTAVSVLNSISHRILRMYEKDLGKGNTFGPSHSLALSVFYQIAKCVTEDWLVCPSLRYFVSDSLETLASVVVSGTPGQATKLLSVLIASPHLSPFLSAHFIPNINNNMEIIEIYKTICELPDGDGALPFVLLSKVDMRNWLSNKPEPEEVSKILRIIGGALSKTGHDPDPNREMLHGLHRRHLFEIFNDNRAHYAEILKLFLSLSEKTQLDPNLWIDLLNSLTKSPGKFSLDYQSRDERLSAVTEFVLGNPEIYLQETADVIAEITKNFQHERFQFGLYGLYPKYRSYVEALTPYFYLLSLQLVFGQIRINKDKLSHEQFDFIWKSIETLYAPWLFPLNSSARASTANWIQQLTNESTLLPPWIPGDSASATSIITSFVCCVQEMMSHDLNELVLSKMWTLYATQWAQAGVKDHIFGVIHPAISTLQWTSFRPSQYDIDLMVRVMDMFLPPCHSFLGTVFVQIDWKSIVEKDEMSTFSYRLFPALLSLLVKLSGEPNVRQSGKILSILTEANMWSWGFVDSARFEALAQWLVMSIDCKCVVKHHERNPVDEATLRLFRSAAELKEDNVATSEHGIKKQKVWVKCCTKLLTSCGSKHKNFLSYNQPALHTTLRKILEDISTISSADSLASPALVKDFLTILNSNNNSVLPGSALMVLQSWLNNQSGKSSTLHSFLNQAGMAVTDIKLASTITESVLEAYFKDSEDDYEPAWSCILDHISWPSGNRIIQLLDQSLSSGHILLLYAYILFKRPQCISSKEEQVLASTVLDWVRHLSQQPCPGMEPKLPLLYRELLILLQRQSAYSPDQGWVAGALVQFCDVLLNIAESSPGWGQNFLGAIGLRSSADISLKGKFLARALYIFLRILVNMDKTGLVEKELDEESTEKRNLVLTSPEVKPHMEKVQSLKSNKAFSGIHDVIDWVITQTKDESNTLADATLYLDYLVVNRLYTELFLKIR